MAAFQLTPKDYTPNGTYIAELVEIRPHKSNPHRIGLVFTVGESALIRWVNYYPPGHAKSKTSEKLMEMVEVLAGEKDDGEIIELTELCGTVCRVQIENQENKAGQNYSNIVDVLPLETPMIKSRTIQ